MVELERLCGACNKLKPLSDFYKDGKTPDGKVRYRRDCKECYKKARHYAHKKGVKHGHFL